MRVLLIEDDEDVASLVVTGLREAGHDVVHAARGAAGFTAAIGERFDVMIFDRQLPGGVDGANLLQDLRARDVTTPVLFLSGLGGLQDWIRGLDVGGDDYVVKTFVFGDMLTRVEKLHAQSLQNAAAAQA